MKRLVGLRLVPWRELTLGLAVFSVFSGCSATRKFEVPNAGVTVIDYDARRRGAYLHLKENGDLAIVSEPSPDAAREITASLGLEAKTLESVTNPKLRAEYANKVVDLANRSQTLQVLREALFRLSEIGASSQLKPEQIVRLYIDVLFTVKSIALTELSRSVPEAERGKFLERYLDDTAAGTVTVPTQ